MKNFNLNKTTSAVIRITLVAALMAGCIYSGRVEYNDEVLSGMSSEKYDFISNKIHDNSRSAVVSEYISNRQYYDSLDY